MSPDLRDVFDEIPEGCGPVGLLSSDEFLAVAEPFDGALLSVTGKRIALIFAADPRGAARSARLATSYYRRLGAEPLVVDVLIRDDARADALPDYDVLFLAGGSPAALVGCLRETPLWQEALKRWRSGAALAGSSAGAMTLCTHMLVPEPGDRRPSRWTDGCGPIEKVALAVHASTAPPEWLAFVRSTAPVPIVALDEGVGVVLGAGAEPVLAGDGRAWVLG